MLNRFRKLKVLFLGLILAAAVGGVVMAYSHAGGATVGSAAVYNPDTQGPIYPPTQP